MIATTSDNRQRLQQAEAQVDAEIGFYIHIAVYVLVIAGLIALNAYKGGEWWAQWPAFGWGLGILGHALGVWGRLPAFLVRWRLRKIHQIEARSRPG